MGIERAAVIGAGVMGGGIAAHLANAGVPVVLLDIVPGAAEAAVRRLAAAEPPAFMHASAARLVQTGTLPQDLGRVGDADWIVEAVVEDPDLKQKVYAALQPVRKPGSIVSSNTSTLPLARLMADQPAALRQDFLVTHFFNPPRFMRLLEVVAGPDTRPDAVTALTDFADRRLGKGVIRAKDTPGFIANRIGAFWLQAALNAARDLGLTVEEADAVAGRPLGFPKTGVFGLLDLVGLDLMPAIGRSLLATLPPDDPYRALQRDWPLLDRLIAQGYTGRKGKGGFYALRPEADGSRTKLALDLDTGQYRAAVKARLDSVAAARQDLRALLTHPDKGGRFAWAMLAPTLAYAAALVPAIADDVLSIDRAMMLGYNWREGPFALMDRVGPDWLAERLAGDRIAVPPLLQQAVGRSFYGTGADANGRRRVTVLTPDGRAEPIMRPDGLLLLADLRRVSDPVARNGSAALWDIGDGVLCLEFTTKMNALDADIMAMIGQAIAIIGPADTPWRALVIYNEGENFSVGANIGMALFAINLACWDRLEELIRQGQRTLVALRDAPFPVVGAPSGLALGGACELLLHCDAVQAHAETYLGLVETAVGVIPAWGGCTAFLARHLQNPRRPHGPMPAIGAAFRSIGLAKVATSAREAQDLLLLRPEDGITLNRDRLLADAKARALALVEGYRPPPPPLMALPGPTGRVTLEQEVAGLRLAGKATPHDQVIAGHLARVLTGGDADLTHPIGDEAVRALEREAFLALIRTPETIARIEHRLETGKALRN